MRTLFFILILVIGILLIIFVAYLINKLIILNRVKQESSLNIIIRNNIINFSSLTLKQKIAQMIIMRGDYDKNIDLTKLNIGGIFLDKIEYKEDYKKIIESYQNNSKIKLFVATDMEGAWNPFKKFKDFPNFSDINTSEKAYKVGLEHGQLLKEIGFNMNFAPVAEFSDKTYGGRVFLGEKPDIKEKLREYIRGLQKNVGGVCKHYPGKGLLVNTHILRDTENICKEDLELFKICMKENISGIMIGHQIALGELDSRGMPSSVSKEVISSIKDFDGLIISDLISMLGLRSFYFFNKKQMYADLINSGENVILDFGLNTASVYKLIDGLEKEVKKGNIDENKINESVKKILITKGYKVVD